MELHRGGGRSRTSGSPGLQEFDTGALDAQTGVLVLDVIAQVNRELGTTTVVITHNAVIAAMADRVLYFGDGLVVRSERNEKKLPALELHW